LLSFPHNLPTVAQKGDNGPVSHGEEKMKRFLLAGALLLAVATLGPTARAQRFEFSYTGSLITFTVPIGGIYQIVADAKLKAAVKAFCQSVPTT
jgi:hypothetical protein